MQFGYKNFHPEFINKEWVISHPELADMLEEANLLLGELNAYSNIVQEVDSFLPLHIAKEATQSSRIEGTQTTLDEAMLEVANITPEKKDDWQEVTNYREALQYAIDRLEQLPLSGRLIRETHEILMQGVRCEHKTPGQFRKSQNWIGGSTLKDALFVPPHHSLVPELMSDVEKFLQNQDIHVPRLIRIGMAHYQFETIHPFLDGNGRTGRMLIILYLMEQKILTKPTLYISDFIEKNRSYYYDNLRDVSERSDIVRWLKFFLTVITATARQAIDTLNKIITLRAALHDQINSNLGKKIPKGHILLTYLYKKPVVIVADVMEALQVTKQTANTLIKDFEKLNILQERTGFKRNRVFVFETYMELFRK